MNASGVPSWKHDVQPAAINHVLPGFQIFILFMVAWLGWWKIFYRSLCKVSSGFGIVNSGKWKTGLWKAWKRTVDFSTLSTARTTTATMSRDEIIIIVIRTVDLKGIVIPWCYLDQSSVLKTPCCAGSGETHKKHTCEMRLRLFFRVNSARPDPYQMAPAPGSHHVSSKPR